jgi:hypothetical protein
MLKISENNIFFIEYKKKFLYLKPEKNNNTITKKWILKFKN